MTYLKNVSGFLFSRHMLVVVAVLLVAAVVWFIGPLIAVEGLQPLASVGRRVAVVVLLLWFAIVRLAGWSFALVGVPAVSLLIWQAGPLLALGNAKPLGPANVRLALIAAIVGIYAVCKLYVLWRALQADEKRAMKILGFGRRGEASETDKEAQARLAAVADVVQQAISQLRGLRSRGGVWRRIFEGKRYLYELPWYMVVGSAQAGKTTALLNAGLPFPSMGRMGHASKTTVLQSSGGTSHCDWWFANEAVLIDTAGRYTDSAIDISTDHVEWQGFLGLLRKHRTRAPINGVIVALNAADLLNPSDIERVARAERVRDRLAELRQILGIRFPVYVVVTKMDLVPGFKAYFQALTSEGRAQVWGFTLPWRTTSSTRAADIAAHRQALREQVGEELVLLKDRLAAGLRARLSEEFDVDRRRRLFALPQEFASLSTPLTRTIDEIFIDSRFDGTQCHHTLRGVYFTSAAQADAEMAADPETLLERLWRSLRTRREGGSEGGRVDTRTPTAHQGFFLQDVLTKVIVPEAHLVRPNLGWEIRFRLLRLLGHGLVVVIFLWLAGALALSFGNNRRYLDTVNGRATVLAEQVRGLFADFKPAGVSDVLDGVRELPRQAQLDVGDPPASYQYGLYVVPPVLGAAAESYAQLQDHMLLPPILRRMEAVLAKSVKDGDARTAYDTLRVYKLLHDKTHYMQDGGARDVRNWVSKDWETADSAAVFGGRAAMVGHVERFFSGARPVQAASLPNEALVRDVQNFLDGKTSTQRVYERAKTAMAPEAPQEFTLVRAVGPQVGTAFSRQGGLPLERGVPGLFTYDGYHDLVDKRLPEFVVRALQDDAWVMGREGATPAFALDTAKTPDDASRAQETPLLDDIRRQYLEEYARHWESFLESIRTVGGGGDAVATGLGFDLSVLRQFAAPDSPLARLARAAARETTLSRPLASRAPQDRGFFDKATDEIDRRTREIGRTPDLRREERLEKQLVDDRFAALREVVTGQADIAPAPGAGAGALAARPGLEALSGLVNEFYTLLVVADTALTAGSLPPGGAEVGARLKLEAGKLPAPFKEVLTALAASGGDKVVQGSQDILRKQAQLQFDRIMGMMAVQVGEPCRRGVEGRYPLAAVSQDASVEDFTQVFSVGGAADEFFTRYLLPFVDTSVRPWRYKSPDTAHAMAGVDSVAAGTAPAPVATGPTLLGELLKLLAQRGPNLETFYRARQIRDLFFREADGRRLGWKVDLEVMELEPTITDLVLDIDGQGQRYIHGPVQSFSVKWPGPRGGSMAELVAHPTISGATSTVSASGPWALFRLLDRGRVVVGATPGRASVEFSFDGRKALLDVSSGSQPNPLNSDLLKGFHCPGRAA